MTKFLACLICGCLFLVLFSCNTKGGQTVDIATLDKDIQTVSAQIAEAETENTQYSGGLVKTLIILRLQILKNTKAMLEHKKYALQHGIPVKYEYDGKVYQPTAPNDSTILKNLESEIAEQKTELGKAQAEDAKYSGGLVKAMILSQIATIKNTIAMLEQKKLTTQYGIPLFALSDEEKTSVADKKDLAPKAQALSEGEVKIVDVDAKVTESNEIWWKYAWRLTIKNSISIPVALEATIEFLDEDGFVVDDDTEYNLYVPAGEEKTFTGYDLVDASVAGNISKVNAKVSRR